MLSQLLIFQGSGSAGTLGVSKELDWGRFPYGNQFPIQNFSPEEQFGGPAMVEGIGRDIRAIREAAYRLWEKEGRPEGQALDHWLRAGGTPLSEEEKVLEGRADANIPAMLTKDVPGG
jgi:hypothetical protein